ncbi:response regulator [Longispora albida]|uniref:response regulator n=1 Tax=Longispora albida TaxID=203523 RepID=UPI0009FE9DDA|nr:response regulator transcription factor [Longispora albida]
MRVLLVDDHPVFAEALAARLAIEPDIEVLPVASGSGRALAEISLGDPDVVLLDLYLGESYTASGEHSERNGLGLLATIRARYPRTKVIMLTAAEDPALTVAAFRAGADGWLPKSAHAAELVEAIRSVARGEASVPPRLLADVLDRLTGRQGPDGDPLAVLTVREREVLQCMVDGLGRAEIAARLHISSNTARTHTQNILSKLGCHSVLEAVALARKSGMR